MSVKFCWLRHVGMLRKPRLLTLLIQALAVGALSLLLGCASQSDRLASGEEGPVGQVSDSGEAKKVASCVLGVQELETYPDPDLSRSDIGSKLKAGEALTIHDQNEDAFLVESETGKRGWIPRCAVCSQDEFNRRQESGELPDCLSCWAVRDGELKFIAGVIVFQGTKPIAMDGEAFWMAESARGETMSLRGTEIVGDPAVLYLVKADGTIAELPVWSPSPDEMGTK